MATLLALCNEYWWSIDDSATNPLLISKAQIVSFINDARKDLAERLMIIKSGAPTVDSADKSLYTLPVDFILPLKVTWGTTILTPIDDINKAAVLDDDEDDTTGIVSKYIMLSRNTMKLFDTPLDTDTSTLAVWYKAYTTDFASTGADDSKEPIEIPPEHHKDLLIYVRAHHALKLGRYSEYQLLLNLWEEKKNHIVGKAEARQQPIAYTERFDW